MQPAKKAATVYNCVPLTAAGFTCKKPVEGNMVAVLPNMPANIELRADRPKVATGGGSGRSAFGRSLPERHPRR
jgi:hypothetical protein